VPLGWAETLVAIARFSADVLDQTFLADGRAEQLVDLRHVGHTTIFAHPASPLRWCSLNAYPYVRTGPVLRRLHLLAHVELELPPAPVARHTPQLQHAGLGDHGLERYRHHLGRILRSCEAHFHGREFLEFVADVFNHVARLVVFPYGGAE